MKKQQHIFKFIKYIKPTWYYNLTADKEVPVWCNYDLLSETNKNLISFDTAYSSNEVSKMDAAYKAWQRNTG